MGHPKLSLTNLFATSNALSTLINKIDELAKINRLVQKSLSPELRPHCRVANLHDGVLILTTASPTFGHQLRYAASDLLSTLRADPALCGLKSIKTHVRPVEGETLENLAKEASLPPPKHSKTGSLCLTHAAANITSQSLQRALLRLAKHVD